MCLKLPDCSCRKGIDPPPPKKTTYLTHKIDISSPHAVATMIFPYLHKVFLCTFHFLLLFLFLPFYFRIPSLSNSLFLNFIGQFTKGGGGKRMLSKKHKYLGKRLTWQFKNIKHSRYKGKKENLHFKLLKTIVNILAACNLVCKEFICLVSPAFSTNRDGWGHIRLPKLSKCIM